MYRPAFFELIEFSSANFVYTCHRQHALFLFPTILYEIFKFLKFIYFYLLLNIRVQFYDFYIEQSLILPSMLLYYYNQTERR